MNFPEECGPFSGRTRMRASAQGALGLLTPSVVVHIGASESGLYPPDIFKALSASPVTLYLVNPHRTSVFGKPCLASVKDLPGRAGAGRADLALLTIPAALVPDALRECIDVGIPRAVVISSGFAESGNVGRALQDELESLGDRIAILGPNCAGFANLRRNITAARLYSPARSGNIALVSQSGALMMALHGAFAAGGAGLSYVLSVGNQAGYRLSDFLREFATDPGTGVVASFIEGIPCGHEFVDGARSCLDAGKPVIAVKSGRTELGRRLAETHTASLSGDGRVFEAVARQTGVILVDDTDELLAASLVAQTLLATGAIFTGTSGRGGALAGSAGASPGEGVGTGAGEETGAGDSAGAGVSAAESTGAGVGEETGGDFGAAVTTGGGIAWLSQSGGLGSLAGDLATRAGIPPGRLPSSLGGGLNPVDLGGDAFRGETIARTLAPYLECSRIRAVVLLLAKNPAREIETVTARSLIDAVRKGRKPVFVVWVGPEVSGEPPVRARSLSLLVDEGIPLFRSPKLLVNALARLAAWQDSARFRASRSFSLPERDEELRIPGEGGRTSLSETGFRVSASAAQEGAVKTGHDACAESGPGSERFSGSGKSARSWLEGRRLLSDYGIPLVPDVLLPLDTPDVEDELAKAAPELGEGPWVLKLLSEGFSHKSDAGFVALNIPDIPGLKACARSMRSRQAGDDAAFLLQPMIRGGCELFLGTYTDREFGPVVAFGAGGIFVEKTGGVDFLLPPFSPWEARRMAERNQAWPLISGLRGRKVADIGHLVDVLVSLGRLALEHAKDIVSLDLNPFVLFDRGMGGFALDARFERAPSLSLAAPGVPPESPASAATAVAAAFQESPASAATATSVAAATAAAVANATAPSLSRTKGGQP